MGTAANTAQPAKTAQPENTAQPAHTVQPASRRRGSVLEEAILEATRAELVEHGYVGLTMEGVAARAQTSKPVVYRRWPSRAKLAVAAMMRSVPDAQATPDTGALRTDLIEQLRAIARRFGDLPQGAVFGVLADSLTEPEVFRQVQEQVTGQLQDITALILRRAVERGEIRGDRLTPRVVRAPLDLMRSELFLRGAAPPDEFLVETVDQVLLPLFHAL